MVQYKSKYSQAAKSEDKNKQSSIINLSDGRQVNYDYRVGPGDPIGPSFNVVTVDNQ